MGGLGAGIALQVVDFGDYEGGDGKSYNAVSTSLGDHPPQASRVYFGDSRGHYTVARIKK